jgi:hypothetical protein
VTGSAAFTILPGPASIGRASNVLLKGYLDDLARDLNAPSADPDLYAESKEATDYDKSKLDRYGPGSFDQYVELADKPSIFVIFISRLGSQFLFLFSRFLQVCGFQ